MTITDFTTNTYKIAGHSIAIVGNKSIHTLAEIHAFDIFSSVEEIVEWKILFDQKLLNPPFDIIHQFSFEAIDCIFGHIGNKYVFTMTPQNGDTTFRMEYTEHSDTIYATGTSSEIIMRFALWMAFNLLGIDNTAAIHSSCIVYQNKAILFLGESGTGKSTHTALWYKNIQGARLLNDDSPILRITNGNIVVYGSPWSGKTPCYKVDSYPVSAFVRLKQAAENSITKLNTIESIAAIYPSLPPAFAHDETLSKSLLELVAKCIAKVPVYQLNCLPNLEAAELVKNTLYKPVHQCV